MKDWYTRQEVADKLGIAKTTVYHYAKQEKIIKIQDPHRLYREARYKREEVDALVEERKKNQPNGLRPSEIARQLGVPVARIYTIIKENKLPVDEIPLGDEMTGYSIPDELAKWIQKEVERTKSTRGTRSEYYDSKLDITLYQRFSTQNGQDIRVLRNENLDWGFYSQSRMWIPFDVGIQQNSYEPAYSIHQKNRTAGGYTDFSLPKDVDESFDFLDFVYQVWGIENIRLREMGTTLELSIKSGTYDLPIPLPRSISQDTLNSFIVLGEIEQSDGVWALISGYRRTTVDLPTNLLDEVENVASHRKITMSEYIESAIREKMERN